MQDNLSESIVLHRSAALLFSSCANYSLAPIYASHVTKPAPLQKPQDLRIDL
jgi:hypothetical protein